VEESARIFHWNSGLQQWDPVGGDVDTLFNEVTASITETGVYAIFTTSTPTAVGDDRQGSVVPEQFELDQNHPNPFNPSTSIRYALPVAAEVRISIFNVLRQLVKAFDEGLRSPGRHEVTWNGDNEAGREVGSGVYFYRLEAGDVVKTRRMVLLR
jgi:hypothetical protein